MRKSFAFKVLLERKARNLTFLIEVNFLATSIKPKQPNSPTGGELNKSTNNKNANEFISRAEFERFCAEIYQKMEKISMEISELKKQRLKN